ncbi:MAG: M50 family metallopeptidase [Candidatus Marinimicrobia bacterium]|nr:M50 family metallopeptidase [Candidatus Neomarinimicrobiota bacterium]
MKKIIIFGGILLFGGFIGWLIGSFSKFSFDIPIFSTPNVFGMIIYLFGALILVILIHELGHVIGGKLAGYSFFMLTVGPFKWVREQGKVRWRWNTTLNTLGGLTLMVPRVGQSKSQGMALLIIGGPFAGLCLFVISTASILIINMTQPGHIIWGHITFFLMIVAILALGTTVGALLPFSTKGFASDGGQLLDILRGGHRAERRQILMTLSAFSLNGTRPRELDHLLVNRLLELSNQEKDQVAVAAHHFAFYHYLDMGRIDIAGAELDRALELKETYPAELQSGLCLEHAYYQARFGEGAKTAEESLKKGSGGFVEAHTRARAEAAVALSKGDIQGAKIAIDLALSRIDRSIDKGGAKAEKDWIQELYRQVPQSEKDRKAPDICTEKDH